MLDDKQKTKGYVVQTFLINLGAVVGAFLPLILSKLGVSDAAAPGTVAKHIAYSYYIGGAILLLTVIVTSIRTKEYPPEEFAKYNSETLNQPIEKKSFWKLLKDLPTVMLQLSVVQFFSWAALFLMWTYLKPAISGVVISHAAKKLLPWIDGLLDAGEDHFKKTGSPLFSSHMLDLSEEPIKENIEICKKYLTRMSKMGMTLELELGITGGEEDGVDNSGVDSSKLYTQPEEVAYAYEELIKISPNFTIAASFGNVHDSLLAKQKDRPCW